MPNISEVIAAHREAVIVDERSYYQDGEYVSKAMAAATGAKERAAYMAFCTVQCETADDIQAKLDYLLNGTVDDRETLMQCLGAEEYGGWDYFEKYLRSLIVPFSGTE